MHLETSLQLCETIAEFVWTGAIRGIDPEPLVNSRKLTIEGSYRKLSAKVSEPSRFALLGEAKRDASLTSPGRNADNQQPTKARNSIPPLIHGPAKPTSAGLMTGFQ